MNFGKSNLCFPIFPRKILSKAISDPIEANEHRKRKSRQNAIGKAKLATSGKRASVPHRLRMNQKSAFKEYCKVNYACKPR